VKKRLPVQTLLELYPTGVWGGTSLLYLFCQVFQVQVTVYSNSAAGELHAAPTPFVDMKLDSFRAPPLYMCLCADHWTPLVPRDSDLDLAKQLKWIEFPGATCMKARTKSKGKGKIYSHV
jgi:hypothetical protein